MEKTDALANFRTSLIFEGNPIYIVSVHFGYYEEEDNLGDIHASEDAQDIYRLIERYNGIGADDKESYTYHVLHTTIGGTMKDETTETIQSYEKYATKEEAFNFIENDTAKYENWNDTEIFIDKRREDIEALQTK